VDIEKIVNKVKSIPTEFWWRGLSYILSTLFFVPNITLIMFLIYMGEHNFFSYDFFIEGVFGMKLFFLTTAIFLFITAIIIYSPIFLALAIKKAKKDKKIPKSACLTVFFVSGLTWFMIIYKAYNGADLYRMAFILGICFFIAGHLATLIFHNAKTQFISLFAVTAGIIFFSVNYPAQSSKAISIGLQAYGVGGDLPISITNSQSEAIIKGKLKLITPKNIYFSPENGGGVATYSLNNVSYYVVGKN